MRSYIHVIAAVVGCVWAPGVNAQLIHPDYEVVDQIGHSDIAVHPSIGANGVLFLSGTLTTVPDWHAVSYPSFVETSYADILDPELSDGSMQVAILDTWYTELHTHVDAGLFGTSVMNNITATDEGIRRLPRLYQEASDPAYVWQEWERTWDVVVHDNVSGWSAWHVPENLSGYMADAADQMHPAVNNDFVAYDEGGAWVVVLDRFSRGVVDVFPGAFPDLDHESLIAYELPGAVGVAVAAIGGGPIVEYFAPDFGCTSFHRPRLSQRDGSVVFRGICGEGEHVLFHAPDLSDPKPIALIPGIHDPHRAPQYDVGFAPGLFGEERVLIAYSVRYDRGRAEIELVQMR